MVQYVRSFTVSCDVDSNQDIVVISHSSLSFDGTYPCHVSPSHCGFTLHTVICTLALCSITTRGGNDL